jgi:hypothetical protein
VKRLWTIIGVGDVPGSVKWYQSLLGQPQTAPAHDDFGQILDGDGTVLLCLHEWGAHEHPSLMSPITRSLATASSCSSVSMISTRPCQEHGLSSLGFKRSPT